MSAHTNGTPEKPSNWWTRGRILAVAAGGVAATLIGIAAIAVPLIAAAGEEQSTPETVVARDSGQGAVEVARDSGQGAVEEERLLPAVSDGLMAAAGDVSGDSKLIDSDWYAVPVDAPWEELFSLPPACSGESGSLAWIEAHGVPMLPTEIMTTLSNVATAGSDAVVSDIRAEGELTVPPVETVVVGVMKCRGGGDEGVFATMTLGVDPVAVFDECYSLQRCVGSAEESPVSGEPVVFSLAPGEQTTLHLTWDQTLDFVGRFVATVTVDGESSTIDLSPEGVDLVVPWVTYPDRRLYISYDTSEYWCESAPDAHQMGCTADTWRQIVANG